MIREFATRDALMRAAAETIADALNKGISARGEGVAALSGGSTPEPAYTALAALSVEWKHVTFLLVDERFVPISDAASNEAMLRRALAGPLGKSAKLVPMYAHGATAEQAAQRADAVYATKHIDIALMGMGPDGHTASWFPQSEQLGAALDLAQKRTVISVEAPGAAGAAERLTLTRAALARTDAIALLITGDEKRRLLEDKAREALPVDGLFDLPVVADVLWAR